MLISVLIPILDAGTNLIPIGDTDTTPDAGTHTIPDPMMVLLRYLRLVLVMMLDAVTNLIPDIIPNADIGTHTDT